MQVISDSTFFFFQVWLTKGPQCEIPVQIISLALYIELSLGKCF